MERIVKFIQIPVEIWENQEIGWNEKVLLMEIDSYTQRGRDCFVSDEYIADFLSVSVSTAKRILSNLIHKGFIRKTRFDGRRRYIESTLRVVYGDEVAQDRSGSQLKNELPDSSPMSEYIENKITDKKITSKENKKKDIDLSFVDEELLSVVEDWLRYKKDRHESYKSSQSLKAMYNKLVRLSSGSAAAAREMVDEAMANNWSGFFEKKGGGRKKTLPQYKNENFWD